MNTYQKWMEFSTRLITIMDVTDERREKIMNEVVGFIEMYEGDEIHGWDTITDHVSECFGEYLVISEDGEFGGKFYNQISAVTRAGLDVATEEWGGGVVGYTVGDVRKAYDGHIPDWVCKAIGVDQDESDDVGVWL